MKLDDAIRQLAEAGLSVEIVCQTAEDWMPPWHVELRPERLWIREQNDLLSSGGSGESPEAAIAQACKHFLERTDPIHSMWRAVATIKVDGEREGLIQSDSPPPAPDPAEDF